MAFGFGGLTILANIVPYTNVPDLLNQVFQSRGFTWHRSFVLAHLNDM